jgi:excisionase family DNA binding protein
MRDLEPIARKPIARLLTVQEFARLSGWRPATVRQKLWLRQLPYVKLGSRSVRISEDVLRELIESGARPSLEH